MKILWRSEWLPIPMFLSGEFHGQRNLIELQSMGSQNHRGLRLSLFMFPAGTSGKEPACQCRRLISLRFNPWVRKILWRMAWQATPVFLPREFHEPRSLEGYSHGVAKSQTIQATNTFTFRVCVFFRFFSILIITRCRLY